MEREERRNEEEKSCLLFNFVFFHIPWNLSNTWTKNIILVFPRRISLYVRLLYHHITARDISRNVISITFCSLHQWSNLIFNFLSLLCFAPRSPYAIVPEFSGPILRSLPFPFVVHFSYKVFDSSLLDVRNNSIKCLPILSTLSCAELLLNHNHRTFLIGSN